MSLCTHVVSGVAPLSTHAALKSQDKFSSPTLVCLQNLVSIDWSYPAKMPPSTSLIKYFRWSIEEACRQNSLITHRWASPAAKRLHATQGAKFLQAQAIDAPHIAKLKKYIVGPIGRQIGLLGRFNVKITVTRKRTYGFTVYGSSLIYFGNAAIMQMMGSPWVPQKEDFAAEIKKSEREEIKTADAASETTW